MEHTQELKHVRSKTACDRNVASILHQNAVEDCMKSYAKRQTEEARKAVALIKAIGLQSWKDLITVIQSNVIQNNPVTEKHVECAKDMWQDLAFNIKAKTVRKAAPAHTENCVAAPKKLSQLHNKMHLHLDVMDVCGIGFLTSVSDVI